VQGIDSTLALDRISRYHTVMERRGKPQKEGFNPPICVPITPPSEGSRLFFLSHIPAGEGKGPHRHHAILRHTCTTCGAMHLEATHRAAALAFRPNLPLNTAPGNSWKSCEKNEESFESIIYFLFLLSIRNRFLKGATAVLKPGG